MPRNLKPTLTPYLFDDEKLLWAGKPSTGIVINKIDYFIIPFSILWCGFAIFWVVMAASGGAPWFFVLFGMPFVFVGLYLVFGRFLYDSKLRASTTYGLSDKRILILSGINKKELQSLDISSLGRINFTERRDKVGTISFGPDNPLQQFGPGINGMPGMKYSPAFNLIPDVRKVYQLMLEVQKLANSKV